MERIINGTRFEGNVIPDSWDVRTFEVNGHKEVSARPVVIWSESDNQDFPPDRRDGYEFGPPRSGTVSSWAAYDAIEAEERRQNSLKKSAQRAKVMCRRVIKAESFNELLTLTYRENMNDRVRCKVHFKEWYRRMKKALGDFRFCASFEVQKRGAMHVHVATHKLPEHAQHKKVKIKAWELGTRIWRDVIGDYPFQGPLQPGKNWPELTNGMCFVGGKSRFGGDKRKRNMSIAKMAAYVSKYILKDYEDSPGEKNRYSRSNGTVVPKSTVIRWNGYTLSEVISLTFDLAPDDVIVSHWLGKFGDSWGLDTEPRPQQYP